MKKLLKITAVLLIVAGVFACSEKSFEEPPILGCDCEDELFYYYMDEKQYIDSLFLNDYLIIGFDRQTQDVDVLRAIEQTGLFNTVPTDRIYHPTRNSKYNLLFVNTKVNKTCTQLKEIIELLEDISLVAFANLTFQGTFWIGFEHSDIMSYSDEFLVKVKDESDLSDLYAITQETNTSIKERDEFMHDWYIISADKNSKGNALQMANYFHETGKFEAAEPNFLDAKINR
jgi:hypothetical protein